MTRQINQERTSPLQLRSGHTQFGHTPSGRLLCLAGSLAALALLLVLPSDLHGGGGAGGVDVYPFSAGGGGSGSGLRVITVHSPQGVKIREGRRFEGGALIAGLNASDVINLEPQKAGKRWKLDANLIDPRLTVTGMPGVVLLDGHFELTDRTDQDQFEPWLFNNPVGKKRFLAFVIGKRIHDTSQSKTLFGSFGRVERFFLVPHTGSSVDLNRIRRVFSNNLKGLHLDVGVGLLTRKNDGSVDSTWAAFSADDEQIRYEIDSH